MTMCCKAVSYTIFHFGYQLFITLYWKKKSKLIFIALLLIASYLSFQLETSSSERNKERLSIAVERFMKMITESLKFRELATRHSTPQLNWDLMNSAESAIDYMLNYYVIVHKRQIAGISGYFCINCLTFQFQYIKDIGFDLTAGE